MIAMASQPLRPYLLAQLGWVGFLRDDSKKHTHTIFYLVVSTHQKNIGQIGSFPQIGMKIKHT